MNLCSLILGSGSIPSWPLSFQALPGDSTWEKQIRVSGRAFFILFGRDCRDNHE